MCADIKSYKKLLHCHNIGAYSVTMRKKREKTKSVQLPRDLHTDLKEIATGRGIKLSYLVESFLRHGVTTFVTSGKFNQ